MAGITDLSLEGLVASVMSGQSQYTGKWCYESGLILKAVESAYLLTGDARYFQYIRDWIDRFVTEKGTILDYHMYEFNLDNINPGKILLYLYQETSLEKYGNAAKILRLQLAMQPRNLSGGFWHKGIYPHQMWLDGLYMSSPFLAQYALMFNEPQAFYDVANQVRLLAGHAGDKVTGLMYHAWDESRGMKWSDDETGCSPHFWGRAMGWFVMALVDILEYFPENHVERHGIINTFRAVLQALIRVQDDTTGVWYQILDRKQEKGNYLEASVSCMVTYALLKGIRLGYLDNSMMSSAERAYKGILGQFIEVDGNGSVSLKSICSVAGLGGNPYRDGSLSYYFSEPVATNDYKGYGPLILACVEYQRRSRYNFMNNEKRLDKSQPLYEITAYGAAAGSHIPCTKAIAAAVEACSEHGGGTVFVPSGKFLTGPFELKSHIQLYLDSGAELIFIDDRSLYPVVESRWEGMELPSYMPMIYGKGVCRVSINGFGTLNGQGLEWWKAFREKQLPYPRPRLIYFEDSRSVSIENIRCINSPAWTVHTVRCSDVSIRGISICNPEDSPNTDGINPDSCCNVNISDCMVDVGDDCITLKAGTERSIHKVACENIVIENCTLVHGHGGIVVGSETSGGVRNVTVSNCTFRNTDRGIRLKTRRGRGGAVEDVFISDCVMDGVLCPFVLHQYYFCGDGGKEKYVGDKKPYPVDDGTPVFKRIHLKNISVKDASLAAAFLYGLPEMPIMDLCFDTVHVSLKEGAQPGIPAMMEGLGPIAGKGFICINTKNISFCNVTIKGNEGPAFEIHNSCGISFNACPGIDRDDKALSLEHCTGVYRDGQTL